MGDTPEEIDKDLRTIAHMDAVPVLLRVIGETTGMGFAAVARVTEGTWTACAVYDRIAFNLKAGEQLDVSTTLCKEVRASRAPVLIEHASLDPAYCQHRTPKLYGIESYISVPIVLSDGQYFGNLCAIDPQPLKIANPSVVAMFISFAKVIAFQLEGQREREKMTAALVDERAASDLREQFIAVLSHDLRNPLAGISAIAQLLKRQATDPAKVGILAERITDCTHRMSALINDTMDLARARLGGGIDVVKKEVTDIGPPLMSVVHELRDAQPGRHIEADLQVQGPVFCDLGRVQQLVSNLLANALTHGAARGLVKLKAWTTETSLVIEVANSGEPIPPDTLQQMFSPFWRRSTGKHREGLGLGLYICSQVAKAHQGTLEAKSSRRDGTHFTARLPRRA